jgi:hypothetical protein
MTVYRARLSKEALLKLPPEERKLFLVLGHIANEIKGIQKLLAWSSDFSLDNEVLVQGRISISLMLLKILAGKLNEAHEVIRINFYHPDVSKSYSAALLPKGKDALAKVKRYFSGPNIVHKIRNAYAFHYSPQSLDDALEGLPDKLDIYLEDDGNANNLFYFAEALAGRALLQSLSIGEEQAAFSRLIKETLDVAGLVDNFIEAFMLEFIERYRADIWEGNAQAVLLEGLTSFGSIHIDWFTDTSELLERLRAEGVGTGQETDKTA